MMLSYWHLHVYKISLQFELHVLKYVASSFVVFPFLGLNFSHFGVLATRVTYTCTCACTSTFLQLQKSQQKFPQVPLFACLYMTSKSGGWIHCCYKGLKYEFFKIHAILHNFACFSVLPTFVVQQPWIDSFHYQNTLSTFLDKMAALKHARTQEFKRLFLHEHELFQGQSN